MKLLDKYRQISEPVKASVWFLFCSVLQKGIAMLTTPIFTRIMTDAAYGRFTVYNSWYNIFFAIVTLNLAAGVFTKGLVKHEEKQDEYASSIVALSTVCISAGFLVYLIFNKAINSFTEMSTFLTVAMFVEIWSCSVYQFWSNKERVNYKYVRLVIITVIYVIARPLFGVIFVLNVSDELQVESRVLSIAAICFAMFSVMFAHIMIKGKKVFDKQYWSSALRFNVPLIPHYLSQIVLNQSDKIMISKMCDETKAAYYGVAYSVATVMLIVNTAISGTLNPWIYKTIKAGRYHKIGKVSYLILGLIAFCNFLLVAVSPELLKIMAPASYYEAVWLIPPLTVGVYFIFLYSLFAAFEYYYEKTNYVAIASVLGALLNIVLNYFAIKKFGYIAAGFTTLICYVVFVMLHYAFMRLVCKKYMNGYKVYDVRIILAIGTVLLIASALMACAFNYWYIRYAAVIVLTAVLLIFSKKIIIWFKKEYSE